MVAADLPAGNWNGIIGFENPPSALLSHNIPITVVSQMNL
jgi:hypothetical protein